MSFIANVDKKKRNERVNVIIPILLLIIIIAAVAFGTYMNKELAIRRMKESLYIQVCNQAEALQEKIENKYALLNGLGTVFTSDNVQDLDYVLKNLNRCAKKTDFITVDFIYPDGTGYRNDGAKMDLSERWYFQKCMEGQPAIEHLKKGKLVDEVRIGIAVPVIWQEQIIGVLVGDYNDILFQNLFETVNRDISDYAFVCNSDGKVISGTAQAKALLEENRKGIIKEGSIYDILKETRFIAGSRDYVMEQMKNRQGGDVIYVYNGKTRYAMYEPVGINDWYVVTIVEESQIHKEAMETAKISYIMLVAVMAAVTCIIFYLIIRERKEIRREKKKSQELRYILEHDDLTGVLTEKVFQTRVTEWLKKIEPGEYCLVYMDIYKFKLINEMFGYDKGNKLLCAMAEELNKLAEQTQGLCGRINADKFVVFIPYRQEIIDEFYTKKLRKERIIPSDIYIHYGIYIITNKEIPVERMIDCAQLAQRAVKGNYDNCVNYYNDELKQQIVREQEIISTMGQALKDEEFIIYLQPQYNYKTGIINGAEALVRWNSPIKGLISPGVFIPIFETNGFIIKLDEYVWEQVCKLLRSWIDRGYRPFPISINVSRADLLKGSVAEKLKSLIDKYNLTTELLRVEITESAYMDNPQQLIMEINRMKEMGFLVEMDDFGSGYSSLNMLKDVPINVLKTDLKFLSNTSIEERRDRILDNVIHMAHQMGEYYGAAEQLVRSGESHLSGLTEPLRSLR